MGNPAEELATVLVRLLKDAVKTGVTEALAELAPAAPAAWITRHTAPSCGLSGAAFVTACRTKRLACVRRGRLYEAERDAVLAFVASQRRAVAPDPTPKPAAVPQSTDQIDLLLERGRLKLVP